MKLLMSSEHLIALKKIQSREWFSRDEIAHTLNTHSVRGLHLYSSDDYLILSYTTKDESPTEARQFYLSVKEFNMNAHMLTTRVLEYLVDTIAEQLINYSLPQSLVLQKSSVTSRRQRKEFFHIADWNVYSVIQE